MKEFTVITDQDIGAGLSIQDEKLNAKLAHTVGSDTDSQITQKQATDQINLKQNTLLPGKNINIRGDGITAVDTTYEAGAGVEITTGAPSSTGSRDTIGVVFGETEETVARGKHTHDASEIVSGTIDIRRLPAAALERLTVVPNEAARFALTKSEVQTGDTVQQEDTKVMYRVVDSDKLNLPGGYREYSAGTAAQVEWSGVKNKPLEYPSAPHEHDTSDITSGVMDLDRLPITPVSKGGTGANSAVTARSNLGLGSASTSDVTQVTGNSVTGIMSQKAVTDALGTKVDKVPGKELSTNDFSTAEKIKLQDIEERANRTVVTQSTGTSTSSVMSQKAITDQLNTKTNNTDPRLTNARDWTQPLVTQLEAEAGTSPEAKKFSPERVQQAFQSFFSKNTTPYTRGILKRVSAAQVRSDLGLGTAALKDTGENAGNVMEVGAGGWMSSFSSKAFNANDIPDITLNKTGFYPYLSGAGSTNVPAPRVYIQSIFYTTTSNNCTQIAYGYEQNSMWVRYRLEGVWSTWNQLTGVNDLEQVLGDSTKYAVSQKVVTDSLNTKVDKIAGKGLSQNDLTDELLNKIHTVGSGQTQNASDEQLRDRQTHTGVQAISTVQGLGDSLASKVDKVLGKGLSPEEFLLTEKTKLTGIEHGQTKNSTDAQLRDRQTHTGEQAISTVTGLQANLDSRVLKELGKGLSTEDFTTGLLSKLNAIQVGQTKNQTDQSLRDRQTHTGVQAISTVTGLQAGLDSKVDKAQGKSLTSNDFSDVLKTKLDGIQVGQTKNSTDAQLRDRQTHTGVQAISTVTGLQAGLDSKVNSEVGKGLSTNDFTQALLSKLNAIQVGQTKNSTDAQLRDRQTHTGVQAISTVTGLDTALSSKVDKVQGYGLSQNNYTPAEKAKLASLESSKFKGLHKTVLALQAAVPNPSSGDYADVDLGVGSEVTRYIWDASDLEWAQQAGASSALTTDQIKSMYESNPNTNQFTDQDKTKLTGVQTGQTKNATDAQLRQRSSHTGTQATSTIVGLDAALQSKVNTETGKGLSQNDFTTVLKTKLDGIQTGQTQNSTDAQLRQRSTHTGTQPVSTITGLSDQATTTVQAIQAGTTKADVGLSNVSNLADKDRVIGGFIYHDTRSVVSTPQNISNREGRFDFKYNTSVDNPPEPASGTYSHIMTNNGWSDGSGGWGSQVSFGKSLQYRSGVSQTAWGDWNLVMDTGNTITLGKTKETARDALNITADSSGVLTEKPLSAFISSYLKSSTVVNARSTLGLGNSATLNVGTQAGTVQQGNDARLVNAVSNQTLTTELQKKVNTEAGKGLSQNDFTSVLLGKLNGIQVGQTKNSPDQTLLARGNHTGVQQISTITGLQAELDSKEPSVAGKGLSTNDFTQALLSKLNGIQTGQTQNATDAQLRQRSSHTGTQPVSTITGLQDAATTTVQAIRAGTTKANVGLGSVDNFSRQDYDLRYLGIGAKAVDSDKLNGQTGAYYLNAGNMNQGVLNTARLPAQALVDTKYTSTNGVSLSGTTFSADSTVIRTTGNQSLAGVKTFSTGVVMQNSGTEYKGTGTGGYEIKFNPSTNSLDFNFSS